MSFLLLFPAVLLLLATPAITRQAEIPGSIDDPALPENPMIPTASPEKALKTASSQRESISSSEEEKLKGEHANANARLILLEDDKKQLKDKLKSKTSELRKKKIAAARELEETKKKLQETLSKQEREITRIYKGNYEFILNLMQLAIKQEIESARGKFDKLYKPSSTPKPKQNPYPYLNPYRYSHEQFQ